MTADDWLAADATTAQLRQLGRYTLTDRVGEGGMGVVYRALDPSGNVVAVKLLRPHIAGDADSRARFAREARVLGRVRGPHVAEVLDADVDADTPYLVTRFVSGPSLLEVVERTGPMSGSRLTALARDLADALCSVHEAGVVHRDLKPGNVLLRRGEPVVIDFGIAQLADETRLTVTGMVFGTPGYLAPELLAGGAVSAAADVYAWAATLVFATTGRAPHDRGRFAATAYAVLHDEPDLDGVPPRLAPLLAWCLAKEPAVRPSAAELRDRLERRDLPTQGPVATAVLPPEAAAGADAEPARVAEPAVADARPDADAELGEETGQAGEEHEPEAAAPGPHPAPRRRLVTVLLFLLLGALGAVVPLLAGAGLVGWLLLARTVDRSARFLQRRRAVRGRRRSDGFAAAGALPWHGLVAAVLTLLTLPVAGLGAGLLVALGILGGAAAGVSPDLRLAGGAGGLLVGLLAWAGLDGASVRRGGRRVLGRLLRSRGLVVGAGLVVLVATGGLVGYALAQPDQVWPLLGGSRVRDLLLDALVEIGVRL